MSLPSGPRHAACNSVANTAAVQLAGDVLAKHGVLAQQTGRAA